MALRSDSIRQSICRSLSKLVNAAHYDWDTKLDTILRVPFFMMFHREEADNEKEKDTVVTMASETETTQEAHSWWKHKKNQKECYDKRSAMINGIHQRYYNYTYVHPYLHPYLHMSACVRICAHCQFVLRNCNLNTQQGKAKTSIVDHTLLRP